MCPVFCSSKVCFLWPDEGGGATLFPTLRGTDNTYVGKYYCMLANVSHFASSTGCQNSSVSITTTRNKPLIGTQNAPNMQERVMIRAALQRRQEKGERAEE